MFGIKRPGYLVVPAYIAGIFAIVFCATSVPPAIGVSVAAVVYLALVTPVTFLHTHLDGELFMHLLVYGLVVIFTFAFAVHVIPSSIGPAVAAPGSAEMDMTWLQLGFVILQQALYFGVHAFFRG